MPKESGIIPGPNPSSVRLSDVLTKIGVDIVCAAAASIADDLKLKILNRIHEIALKHGTTSVRSTTEFLQIHISSTQGLTPSHVSSSYNEKEDLLSLVSQISIYPDKRAPTISDLRKIQSYFESLGDEEAKKVFSNLDISRGKNPLFYAAFLGDLEFVKFFLSKGFKDIQDNQGGNTALILAVPNRQIAQVLIENGSDVNKSTHGGLSAFHALFHYHKANKEFIELLVKNKAHINEPDEYGTTPLGYAIMRYAQDKLEVDQDMIEYLIKNGASIKEALIGLNQTYLAFRNMPYIDPRSSLEPIKNLITLSLEINPNYLDDFDERNETPIHWAAHLGYNELLKEIIRKKHGKARVEYVNSINENGTTALILASRNNHMEAVEILLRNGADVAQDIKLLEVSLLHPEDFITASVSVELNILSKVQEIAQENGHNFFDDKFLDNKTPIFWASSVGQHVALIASLEAGANVNQINEDGMTALFLAKDGGIVWNLILYSIDTEVKDNKGRTAIEYLKEKGGNESIINDILLVQDQFNSAHHEMSQIKEHKNERKTFEEWLLSDDGILYMAGASAVLIGATVLTYYRSHHNPANAEDGVGMKEASNKLRNMLVSMNQEGSRNAPVSRNTPIGRNKEIHKKEDNRKQENQWSLQNNSRKNELMIIDLEDKKPRNLVKSKSKVVNNDSTVILLPPPDPIHPLERIRARNQIIPYDPKGRQVGPSHLIPYNPKLH